MKDRINVAELLKGCPKGMELDCTMFDDVYFDYIDDVSDIINCYIQDSKNKIGLSFSKYGHYSNINKTKCVIFPKGKTTWEGFVPPCQFNDGDIIFTHANCLKVGLGNNWISIFQEKRNGGVATYVDYAENVGNFYSYNEGKGLLCMDEDIISQRFATKEEEKKLFQAIKDNGYKWNSKTKTLEKLIEPKFNVGDRIRRKNSNEEYTIISISDYTYYYRLNEHCTGSLGIQLQDDYELVPDKFDINTLVPFESRVLVRDNKLQKWSPAIWGFYYSDLQDYKYELVGVVARYCIPYEHNEHLLGTTDDCDEFYKTWK